MSDNAKVIPIAASEPDLDPFDDLDRLLVPQDYDTRAGSRKRHLSITVGRPGRTVFFRVKGDWQATAEFVEAVDERRSLYLVMPGVLNGLRDEAKLTCAVMTLHLYVDREGTVGLWPLRVGGDAAGSSYNETARAAAELAVMQWVRIRSNQVDRCYEVHEATNQAVYGSPQWPDLTRNEILRAAFKDKLIDAPGHLVIQKLLGAL